MDIQDELGIDWKKKRKKLFTVLVPILRVCLNMKRGGGGWVGDVYMSHT
jgi:hypothetical protein